MTRLTVSIKNEIVNKALTIAGVDSEFAALIKRRGTLAKNIRLDCLGGAENISKIQKHFAKIKKLKSSDLIKNVSKYSSFHANGDYELNHINLGGMRVNLQYNGQERAFIGNTNIKSETYSVVPIDGTVTYTADHEFTKDFLSIEGECKLVHGKKEGIVAQVRATINQFTTVKKLLEAWPEAKDLIPADVDEVKPKLPVVLVKDLNCLIGLPE